MAEKTNTSEKRTPNRIQVFYRETVGELRKVNWPTRQEAWNLTKVVLLVLFTMSLALGFVDLVFSRFFAWILS